MKKHLGLFVLLATAISCSTPEKKTEAPIETKAEKAPPTSEILAQATPAQTPAAAHHGHSDSHSVAPGVSSDKALGWMRNGNLRFVKGSFRKDGRGQRDRARLAAGQKPHTVVVSCSDSRVPPEHVFDQSLGEIFVVRNAGEALDQASLASIEYAVEHLGAGLILVLGHTKCGAVKAAFETKPGSSAGSPALDALVADIKPRLPSQSVASPDFAIEAASNARGVAADLVRRSTLIQKRVAVGHVQVKSGLYHLGSGIVDFH